MKITVIHKDTTIIVDEADNKQDKDSKTSMRWSDQKAAIQETITVMVEQCKKLRETTEANKVASSY